MNLSKRVLGANLTQTERLYLASLSHHDGFPILQRLMDEACRAATEEVMRVDPTAPNYKDVLAATQANARAIHEFCDSIRKNFLLNAELAMQEEKKKEHN